MFVFLKPNTPPHNGEPNAPESESHSQCPTSVHEGLRSLPKIQRLFQRSALQSYEEFRTVIIRILLSITAYLHLFAFLLEAHPSTKRTPAFRLSVLRWIFSLCWSEVPSLSETLSLS
jgi:hypothetical protein